MAKVAFLKPRKLLSRASSGLSAWTLNIPANLSDTGKRRRLFFATERQASAEAERLKTRAHNFGASLGNLTSSQTIEAADCYELLAGFPEARLKDAALHYRETLKARAKSVTYLELFNRYLAFKQNCSQKYLKELRITRDRFPSLRTEAQHAVQGGSCVPKLVMIRVLEGAFHR